MLRILLWPFRLIWAFIGLCFNLMGRMITAVVGLVLAMLGMVLTVTVIGAFAGIPLVLFGLLLLIRAIF